MNNSNENIRHLAAVFLAVSVASCGGETTDNQADADDPRTILRIAYEREIDVLNAYTSQNLVDIQFSMVEGLVTTNELNTYVPVLA